MLKDKLYEIASEGVLSIAQVDDLLSLEWTKLVSDLPKQLASDAMVEYHFLKGMKDEFEDGYWDGAHDEDMISRLRSLLVRM